jgi:Protein of unknown function (DUF1573)
MTRPVDFHEGSEFMTRLLPVLFASFLVAPALAQLPESRAASAPSTRLVFRDKEHDFGRIRDDKKVSWKFAFTNGASAPVTIVDVHSSCGCTTTTLAKKTYAPGEAGEIEAMFDPVSRQGKERKAITVKTDEPGAAGTELGIVVDVIPRIGVDPPAVFLGEIPSDAAPGTLPKKQLTVTSRVPDFMVRSAKMGDDKFTLVVSAPVAAEADGDKVMRYGYEVSLAGNVPIGRHQTMLTIETNDAMRPNITVPIIVEAFGELRLAPSSVGLNMPRPGAPVDQSVIVTTRSGKPFHILEATFSGGEPMKLKADIERFMPNSEVTWRVRISGTSPEGGTRVIATLKLKTDVAAQPEIVVPVTGYVLTPAQAH